jgi:hypothetical protein
MVRRGGSCFRVEHSLLCGIPVEGEKTGDGISYASHVKNPNPLKARATTFYDPVHNALDKEAQCAWKESEGSHWPSVYIQKLSAISSLFSLHGHT